jgi:hypothetical protein
LVIKCPSQMFLIIVGKLRTEVKPGVIGKLHHD